MRLLFILFAIIAAVSSASIANDYLPPVADISLPSQNYIGPDANEEPAALTDNGYHYEVVRKLKLRQRRDVSELSTAEYLPPAEEIQEDALIKDVPEEDTILADDGYRYKTVRRLKYRHRRDVNALYSSKYLPDATPEVKTFLADDGYRYKTVRRLKYRYRRDANELPSSEDLPAAEVTQDEAVVDANLDAKTVLADNSYRNKSIHRLKYRHRRDVNEIPSSEYLPPAEETQEESVVDANPEVKTVLAYDGYRYKTVRRLKYRHRRDINELPSNKYLPVAEETKEIFSVVSVPEGNTVLTDDGYRYKTVRRLKYRHRRDVNELPSNEYLPPNAEESGDLEVAVQNPEETVVLANDGYHYKAVRKLKYRRH